MSTQLVPQNGQRNLAAPIQHGLEGMDGFSTADMEIPVIKIVHGTSRMEGADQHIGQFWLSVSQEFHKTLDVIILNGRHSRALFSGDAAESERPECVSRDAITGSVYGACSGCEFNPEFDQTLWKDKTRKRCNKGYTLFLYLPDADEFAIFSAMKTNVQPVRALNTSLVMKHKVPLFGALITFETDLQVEPGKKWYQVLPRVKRVLSPDETAEYRTMSQALKGVSVRIVDEEVAEPVAEEPAPEPEFSGTPDGRFPF